MDDEIDLLALHLVGGRLMDEPSHALPASKYSDPAKFIKFESERGNFMDDKQLHAYCHEWVQWCWTRKYFIKPGSQNILARMQPSKVKSPPDAAMSDEMSYFNMAIHALADMAEHKDDAACFVSYYCERASNIKVVASKMGIGRQTYYDRMNRFARKALSMTSSMKRVHMESMRHTEEIID